MLFEDKLPREYIGKSARARTFVIAMADYSLKDDVTYKKQATTCAHSGKFTIMQDGSMKITDIIGNPFSPLIGNVVGRPYLGFKSIDVFYCIGNGEDSEMKPDPEVVDVDQNGDMYKWEKMDTPQGVKDYFDSNPSAGDDQMQADD